MGSMILSRSQIAAVVVVHFMLTQTCQGMQNTDKTGVDRNYFRGRFHKMLSSKVAVISPLNTVDHPREDSNPAEAEPAVNTKSDEMDHSDHGMWFYASEHATIWFEKWHTMQWWELLLSCLAIVFLGTLYEGFKVYRKVLLRSQRIKRMGGKVSCTHCTEKQCETNVDTNHCHVATEGSKQPSALEPTAKESLTSGHHILQSVLHFLQNFIGMCLMLVFMTYNIWLCLSVSVGAGLGYYCFSWKIANTETDECCS